MLKSPVFRAATRAAFPALTLAALAAIAPFAWGDDKDETGEEESWYCIEDPVENDWDCGLGKAPEPKTAPAPAPGVRPREDYTPDIQPLTQPGGGSAASGDNSLFGATPLAEPESTGGPPDPEPQADEPIRASPVTPATTPTSVAPNREAEAPATTGVDKATAVPASPTGDYVIQLMGGHEAESADAFIRQHQLGNQVTRMSITREGTPWFLVVMGPYPDFETAKQVLFRLPVDLQALDPWVRRLSELE